MKVGDLVRLSAYGKKLESNHPVGPEELGIIVGKLNLGFTIRWFEYNTKTRYGKGYDPLHFRNELKYAK